MMRKIIACALFTAILGFAGGLQAASSSSAAALDRSLDDKKISKPTIKAHGKIKIKREKKEKSAPAPSALLLIGVAAGVVWGIQKMLPNRHAG
jgi:hypothetical protein